MSLVKLSDIYGELIFKWAYEEILEGGGDHNCSIICKNYREVVDWFAEWVQIEYKRKLHWNKTNLHENVVGWSGGQEGLYFTDDENCRGFNGENTYLVETDCVFGSTYWQVTEDRWEYQERYIRGINE